MAPACHEEFDRGVRTIVDAIRPTLGPTPRTVAVKRPVSTVAPEVLDSGAVISRRITSVANRTEDPGAMFLRGLLFRVNDEVGDGTAMTAVLFQALLAEGRKAVAAGIPVQPLRGHLDRIANEVVREVMAQSESEVSHSMLTSVARAACHDAELADLLGEVMDVVGEFGRVDIRPSHRRESWREFVRGTYWESGLLSAAVFADAGKQRTDITDVAVLVTNLALDDASHMVGVLEAIKGQVGGAVILATSASAEVKALVQRNSDSATFPVVLVKAPAHAQREALEDLGVLVGGRTFLAEAGDTVRTVKLEDFGRARSAWVTARQFGVVGPQGDPSRTHQHIAALQGALRRSTTDASRDALLHRMGRFQGISATVWVGASTDSEQTYRTTIVERGVKVLRQAMRSGVVPGGGAVLLHIRECFRQDLARSVDPIEQAALRMVLHALQEPASVVLRNGGHEPSPILDRLERFGTPGAFDAVSERLGPAREIQVVDPARVVAVGARAAIRSASLALTIDAVIHTATNDISVNPE